MKWLYRKSRWIHKYIGLILILFAIWMSISGILMNHPDLIAGISVPKWFTPEQYKFENWNRSAIIQAQFSQSRPGTGYFCGKAGIWKTENDGKSFSAMMQGMPESDYYRKTYSLLLLEQQGVLYAGTEKGLLYCDLEKEVWKEIPLEAHHTPIKKILKTEEQILVFSESELFVSSANKEAVDFIKVAITKNKNNDDISLVRLFFDLHSGKIWGMPGKLLWDLAGLLIIFLSVSAFYIWFNPRKEEKKEKKKQSTNFFLKHHVKLGKWFQVFLICISFTAIFMRPPLLAIIANGNVPSWLYPAIEKPGQWDKKIKNALWDKENNKIIISDDEGFWAGADDLSTSFEPYKVDSTVFVMGTTVFEKQMDNSILLGSFSGIYQEYADNRIIDLITGEVAEKKSRVRPGEVMVTGYFMDTHGGQYITAHGQGLIPLPGTEAQGRYKMPDELNINYRQPLWNFLFELHNGRIFKDFIGGFYLLLVPLGSILFFLIILTGIIDSAFFKKK